MRRREFITSIASAAATWPLRARAQPAMPVIGFLNSGSRDAYAHLLAAFHRGLGETGYAEGRNVAIEYRWAEGQYDRLKALAADLIRHPATVIVANSVSAQVVKAATTAVPIVFFYGGDPIKDGLVASINRPGGNVTGVTGFNALLGAKQVELLHQMVPTAATIGYLMNSTNLKDEPQAKEAQTAAHSFGQRIIVLSASNDRELDAAIAILVREGVGALVIAGGDPFLFSQRDRIAALAARHLLPTVSNFREYAMAGGLMSYGTTAEWIVHQAGIYVGRTLNGAKPADLPVMQPSKFELVINLATAKALGLQIPDKLLALADEVIE